MISIKTQVVFPENVLSDLDRVIRKRERSDFIVQAVQEKLQRLKLQESFQKAAGIWMDHPEMQTDSQVEKYVKRLRGADTRRVRRVKKAWHG